MIKKVYQGAQQFYTTARYVIPVALAFAAQGCASFNVGNRIGDDGFEEGPSTITLAIYQGELINFKKGHIRILPENRDHWTFFPHTMTRKEQPLEDRLEY